MKEQKSNKEQNSALHKTDVIRSFPDNVEIWKWWQTQKFQKEQGEHSEQVLLFPWHQE